MGDLREEQRRFEKFRETAEYRRLEVRPVAYFCAEYALEGVRPIYSGGLGILAGDVLREAGDQKMPMVAIGLFYRNGYLCEPRDVDGRKMEICDNHEPADYGFELVADEKGEELEISVPIHDRNVRVRIWRHIKTQVPFYALDTNCEENSPADRAITDRLYVGDKETRLKQEIVLGIGGMRVLEKLGLHPAVYHLNEGHSALLAFELVRHEMQERHLGFDEAKQYARRRIVMTNHTLVAAGNEIYSYDLVAMHLQRYAETMAVPVHDLISMGLVQESNEFSMTMLALRMAGVVNAVSRLHARKAKEIWRDHPMVSVTNGVHVPTWDRIGAEAAAPGKFWAAHQAKKAGLVKLINERCGKNWGEGDLLVGWARRIVTYKRPTAVFEETERLRGICTKAGRPVRIVFAGHPHPSDELGAELVQELKGRAAGGESEFVAFLEGYDMDLAREMAAGCDVWLNTPVIGFEACGTSGMKAGLNGVLNCSTKDGWVDEADLTHAGWVMGNDFIGGSFCDVLERDIVPLYYHRTAEGYPEVWEKYMVRSREAIMGSFTATRMLREYVEMLYV
jgi:starch phosphorylase